MKNHSKFKCVARVLLNAWLLFPAILTAAQLPNRTAVAVYGQGGDFTTAYENNSGYIGATSLNRADGVAVDSGGNLYVADTYNNRVLYYPKGSTTATRVYGQFGYFDTNDLNKYGINSGSLNRPTAVAVDSSGNLYVADSGNNRVLFYNPPPEFVSPGDDSFYWTAKRVYGQDNFTSGAANKDGSTISTSSLNNPMGLALDSSGNLYIADTSNHRVLSYASGSTIATRVYGQAGSFSTNTANMGGDNPSANSLNMPAGVAVDGIGNVFVADLLNHRVLTYAGTSTTATRVYGQGGSFTSKDANKDGISGNSLNMPIAVLADGSGNLFVTDLSNHRVLCFPSASTTATRVYGQDAFNVGSANKGSSTSASSLHNPFGLAMDSSGNLYVADELNNRVLQYALPVAANGVYGQGGSFTTRNDGAGINATKNSLSYPSTTALDSAGNVYVVDQNNNRVLYYPAGSTTATRVYGQGGSFTSYGQNTGGRSADSLSTPGGIALDSSDNLYVTDVNNHRVLFYPAGNTTATRVYGQGGSFISGTSNNGEISETSLYSPSGVVLDGDGNLYVADTSNNRVLFYPAGNTTATRVYGQGGIFTSGSTNKGGLSANSFYNPYGIILDGSDNLYVADVLNNRVLYFASASTTATRVYGQGGAFNTNNENKGGLSADSLAKPTGVALDGDGNLYVADRINNRSLYFAAGDSNPTTADLVYGQDGSFTTQDANKGGVSANSLNAPYGITAAGGSLYVSDRLNHRVLKYDLPLDATSDTSAPTVSAFSATTPATSFDIPITAFTSTDNIGATGYLITTSSAQPSTGAAGWSTYAPTTYTVAENGNYTLYPWVKDRADNVSAVYGSPLAVLVARPIPTYAVTYDGNGSDGGSTPIDGASPYLAGSTVTVLANTYTKSGYNFAGWYPAADGSGTVYGASFIMGSANTTLFAKWTANDSDSDGMSDAWELKYSGSTIAMSAGSNTDGSGMSNLTKYAFGLDPTKGSSVNPIIDTTALHGAGQFSYTRAANSALTYTVWTSTDLSDWGTTPTAATQVPRVPAVDGVETVDVTLTGYSPPSGGKFFVRVKAQ
jgi:uncharacterized repeat protein (TIGR02543 family)